MTTEEIYKKAQQVLDEMEKAHQRQLKDPDDPISPSDLANGVIYGAAATDEDGNELLDDVNASEVRKAIIDIVAHRPAVKLSKSELKKIDIIG